MNGREGIRHTLMIGGLSEAITNLEGMGVVLCCIPNKRHLCISKQASKESCGRACRGAQTLVQHSSAALDISAGMVVSIAGRRGK